jgi:hypothetical protein
VAPLGLRFRPEPLLSTLPAPERPFVAAARPANAQPVLPILPVALEPELADAWTELAGDGSALVVQCCSWRWDGPAAGEIVGSTTVRRCGPNGEMWDLVVGVTVDPDEPERLHLDVVVRRSDDVRLAEGLPPLGQWWAPTSILRLHERAAIDAAAEQAVDDPPPRLSFVEPEAAALPIRLDAGSLGALAGELRIVVGLGLAYVRATHGGALKLGAAARTMRTAVVDGRLAVPHWIRSWLDRGGCLLAVEGGEL